MKIISIFLMVTAAVIFLPAAILGDIVINDRLTLDGNIRFRLEIEGKDFSNETGMYDCTYLRTMLGFTCKASEEVKLRIKFKESRYLGTSGSNKKSTSFFDLQEGYIQVQELLGMPFDLQLGRYEMLYGRRRIIGNGIWNNFGPRTFDGFRTLYINETLEMDFFFAKVVERSFIDQQPYTGDDFSACDRNLFGVNLSLKKGNLQPLLVVDWDSRNDLQHSDLILMPAIYGKNNIIGCTLEFDAGYQWGKKNDADLNSWLLAADLIYTFPNVPQPLLGLGFDITSGTSEKDAAAGEDHTFYTPFMSRHRFKGFMDYYTDVYKGLFDLIVHFGVSPDDKTNLQLDVHNFQTLEPLLNSTGEKYHQMGQEADLRLRASLAKGLDLDTAVCAYLASQDWQPSGDPGYFYYLTLTAKF